MSSEIFDRLEGLMRSLNLSVEEGTYTRAEMKAYSAGIELAAQSFDELLKNLFVDTASAKGLAMFLSLIGEKPAASFEKSRSIITDVISAGTRLFAKSEYDSKIAALGRFTYSVSGNEIRLNFNSAFNRLIFEIIAELIRDYTPCSSVIDVVSTGHKFSAWDGLGMRWFELDGYELPFYIIDKL